MAEVCKLAGLVICYRHFHGVDLRAYAVGLILSGAARTSSLPRLRSFGATDAHHRTNDPVAVGARILCFIRLLTWAL